MEEMQGASTTVDTSVSETVPSESMAEEISSILDSNDDNTVVDTDDTADVEQDEHKKEDVGEEEIVAQKENSINCPDKFKGENGEPDINKILSSYSELESNYTKKMQELNDKLKSFEQEQENKKLAEIQAQGYSSEFDKMFKIQEAQNLAENYYNYLSYVDAENRQYVHNLLSAYSVNPSQDLLEEIEDNFGIDVIKDVTRRNAQFSSQLEEYYNNLASQDMNNRISAEATEYVNKAYEQYPQWFDRQEFIDFFEDALKVKGDSFEASAFVDHVQKIWDLAQKTLLAEQQSDKQNRSAINSLIGQSPKSAKQTRQSKNIDDYSSEELALAISEFI